MDRLTNEEINLVKKLFVTNVQSQYFHKPDQLKILCEAYRKITGSDLKSDWEKIGKVFF
jgi:hypothetical protein